MITDEEINRFLEHHGVKGQRWGVRKRSLDRISRVIKGTSSRDKKIRKGVALGVGAGAIAVTSSILSRRGMVSIKEANKVANKKAVNAIVNARLNLKTKHMDRLDQNAVGEVRRFVRSLG